MISFILNFPYTLLFFILGLISFPAKIRFNRKPYAIILNVKSFWWGVGYFKKARAMCLGHAILLGPNLENKDLEHELVHVEQHQRMPLIQPLLYFVELVRKGYRNNKYEIEAYDRAGNIYKGIK